MQVTRKNAEQFNRPDVSELSGTKNSTRDNVRFFHSGIKNPYVVTYPR